jgi:hypothetical protein
MTPSVRFVFPIGLGLLCAGSVTAGAQRPLAQNDPGRPTPADVHILNRGPAEAVPVLVQGLTGTLPVTLTGTPTVALAPGAAVDARAARQVWEYRQLVVAASVDPSADLNAAGADGWEAVGVGPAGADSVRFVLKRPR